ncbi:MAG: NAD-dependent epimerase/dehydratase family protein [Gemmataceae bacterium]
MNRVLLTGGSGFVGANLARRLLRDGHEVHLLLRPAFNPWRIDEIRGDVICHLVELTDADALARLVAAVKPDWVFHCAVHGAYSWQTAWHGMVQTNIVGTANLVESCVRQGFEAFINTGSSSEYGYKDHAPAEDELPTPNSHYALTKLSATMFCQHTARQYNARIPTLRLYSVYGPYEEPRRLMPTVIREGLAGRLPPLADPEVARDYIAVADVVDAYLLCATHPRVEQDGVYNVGTGTQTKLCDVVSLARHVFGLQEEPQWGSMANRTWDTTVWQSNPRKLRQLGWSPRTSLEAGFREMADRMRSDARRVA